MDFKSKNSPIKQSIVDPSMVRQNSMDPTQNPYSQIKTVQPGMQYNGISPKAMSNQNTIQNVMGSPMANTPFMQMTDPLTGQPIDPTMDQSPDQPVPPPAGVQTSVTPGYDLNNY